jgi:two-component system, chemotaxis family, CheB/CheR fusion protein
MTPSSSPAPDDSQDDALDDLDEETADGGDGDGARATSAAADPGFRLLLEKLSSEHRVDFRDYKEPSLARRIRRRMKQVKIDTFATYASYMDTHPNEHIALIDSILINVTSFFRDREAWDLLASRVIGRLLGEARDTQNEVRVWSAGCSTGEETYTTAILFAEHLGDRAEQTNVKIYATDVDGQALAAARAGLYRLEQLRNVPPHLIPKYFTEERPQLFRVKRSIRRWCIFGEHNLVMDPPLSHMDLVICRNVLIYFTSDLQERILPRFHYALRERGCLFLGKSESVLARSPRFQPVDAKWRIFERITPMTPERHQPHERAGPDAARAAEMPPRYMRPDPHSNLMSSALNAIPAAIMVIDPADIVILWNTSAEVLYDVPAEAALGRKFRDLNVSYIVEGLRARIEEVKSKRTPARMDGVKITKRGAVHAHAKIHISPVFDTRQQLAAVLVHAEDVTEEWRLREEITRVGDEYATAVEELQSTNEELETANEELQSTNEELETTNEELQSTNEELEAVNAELSSINSQLETNGEHHAAVLGSIEQGICVVDRHLRVNGWNDAMGAITGVRREKAIGQDLATLPLGRVAEKLLPLLVRATAERAPTSGRVPYRLEAEAVERATFVVVNPLVDKAGECTGAVVVFETLQAASGGGAPAAGTGKGEA